MKEVSKTIENVDRKKCVGCFACSEICPKHAIRMVENEQGFLYPQIDLALCIECGACVRTCQIFQKQDLDAAFCMAYVVENKDNQIVKDSTSGGIFSAISSHVIKNKQGIVFGAAFQNGCKEVSHIGVNNLDGLAALRGSKYVQSNLQNVFTKIKSMLDKGKIVLFSGTPCQIRALILFLRKEYENLILVDIICHGVPSPKMWREHIESIEKKTHKKIIDYRCRSKVNGWHSHTEQVFYDDGTTDYKSRLVQKEKWLFNYNYNLRKSCYQCNFTSVHRVGDITIGDCWGIDNYKQSLDNNTGLSLVLINTNKGKQILEEIGKNINLEQVVFTDNLLQRPLRQPVDYPDDYNSFWNLYKKRGYIAVTKKYGRYNFISLIKDGFFYVDSHLFVPLINRIGKK